MDNFTFLTSNSYKIEQYKLFNAGFDIQKGEDLPEILSNSNEIIIFKSKMSGVGTVVEDSIIIVDNVEIVDVKWRYREFFGKDAIWKTSIGINDGKHIYVFSAEIPVKITDNTSAAGFEDNIIPLINNPEFKSASFLIGNIETSARGLAVERVKQWVPNFHISINDVGDWSGAWQNE